MHLPLPLPLHPAIPVQCKIKNGRDIFSITITRLAFLRAFIVGVKIGRPDLSEDSHKLIACAASVSVRVRQESWDESKKRG